MFVHNFVTMHLRFLLRRHGQRLRSIKVCQLGLAIIGVLAHVSVWFCSATGVAAAREALVVGVFVVIGEVAIVS